MTENFFSDIEIEFIFNFIIFYIILKVHFLQSEKNFTKPQCQKKIYWKFNQ